ncbi:NYN domain-containing protein [Corynebacterium urealyticum]|uniref:NYN domain-containing protein n=1 Tax=Corynebacterium urealyticum TaxID=43771 RepID=UPI00293E3DF3|nr:NYN domain-containing protein [Corynebacterium urealyticum]WOH94517.1 NYN domain-containing protein [Corynebacterium urealyticum]
MLERTQIFVDTSYLLASFYNSWETGARAQLEIDLPEVVCTLGRIAQDQLKQPIHRQFWYDGIPESGPHRYQRSLRSEPGVQLRSGQLIEWGDRRTQKAVDTRLVADMVLAAVRGNVSDIVLVSGDADMLPGVEEAVNAGIRVHLYGFGWDSMSSQLRFACDTTTILDPREDFRDTMRLQILEGPLPANASTTPIPGETQGEDSPSPDFKPLGDAEEPEESGPSVIPEMEHNKQVTEPTAEAGNNTAAGDNAPAETATEPTSAAAPEQASATAAGSEDAPASAVQTNAAAATTTTDEQAESPSAAPSPAAHPAAPKSAPKPGPKPGPAPTASAEPATSEPSAETTAQPTPNTVAAQGAAAPNDAAPDNKTPDNAAEQSGAAQSQAQEPATATEDTPEAARKPKPNPSMMARHRKLRSRYVPLPNEVWASAGEQNPYDIGQQYAVWWFDNAASEAQKDNAHLLSGGGLPPEIDRPLLQFACDTLHEYTLTEAQRVGLRDGFHSGIRGIMLRGPRG